MQKQRYRGLNKKVDYISTTKLSSKLNMTSPALFKKLNELGYIIKKEKWYRLTKKGKKIGTSGWKKDADANPSYQRDLIECLKRGYSQLPKRSSDNRRGTDKQRLDVRENCRASGKK